ncbi:hypothetical protein OVA24_02935 [Luteolibacter sp. SL250]|uniref:hypothetical protein n=1 Tax=Luteolibacter sp. SL250 TaxID=2995170 RepID=UPI00226F5D11|nr:hypothetical protein [Luteolibacter sp. SL250]WAC20334.1 hypothetical protein OVA24_02935 [Luteolibacter sp. SL250]
MKPYHLIPIPILALAIGLLRQPELERLRQENTRLQPAAPEIRFRSERRPAPRMPLSEPKREEIVGLVRDFRRMADDPGRGGLEPRAHYLAIMELSRRFQKELAGLNREEVMALIETASAGMDPASRSEVTYFFLYAFVEGNPKEALLLGLELGEIPARAEFLILAFNRSIPADPAFAIRTFNKMASDGLSGPIDSVVRPAIYAARARLEPVELISHLLSPEGAEEMLNLHGLHTAIGDHLRNPGEHRAFLAALRTEAAKQPGSPVAADLRNQYIVRLIGKLPAWPHDEAVRLVDAEFTAEEKSKLVYELQMEGDEPGLWADWVAGLEHSGPREHPVGGFIRVWMKQDRAAVRVWLDGQPEGTMRNTAAKNYAMELANTDPAEAADAAMMLPVGRDRSHALAVIRNEWRKKDPSAWSAFAGDRNLKQ